MSTQCCVAIGVGITLPGVAVGLSVTTGSVDSAGRLVLVGDGVDEDRQRLYSEKVIVFSHPHCLAVESIVIDNKKNIIVITMRR